MKVTLSIAASPLSGSNQIAATPNGPGVTKMEFYVDSVLKSTDTTAPFTYLWDTTQVTDGTHEVKAVAYFERNKTEEAKQPVTVKNVVTPPQPPPPPQAPPVNTSLPVITGIEEEGQTLTVSTGSWTNTPTSYSRQWIRCDAAGANPVPIASAVGSTYLLTAADATKTIRCAVTAFNNAGASPVATSAQTGVISATAPAVPANVTPPAISGKTEVGNALTVSNGAWTNQPTRYEYQWDRCDVNGANCVDIALQRNNSYTLVAADAGKTMRAYVQAFNATGESTPYFAAKTAVVTNPAQPPPPPPPPPPAGTPISTFADIINNSWTEIFINRWYPGAGGPFPKWSTREFSGTGWPSLSGQPAVSEVSTVHGPGFRFRVNQEMYGQANTKRVECCDVGHWVRGLGYTDEFEFKVMFPASNTGFTGYNRNNVFFQYHDNGVGRLPLIMGINPYSGNRFYASCMANNTGELYGIESALPMVLGQWYTMRVQTKWATDSSGTFKWWLDGSLIGNYVGPTMLAGDQPYLQFGLYSLRDPAQTNEVYLAGMSKI